MPDAEQQNTIQPAQPRRYSLAIRRWLPLVAALVLVSALYVVDKSMKSSAVAGFAPEGASFVVAAADFGGLWRKLESTPTHQAILHQALRYPRNHLIAARRLTGIRWTPTRWSAWFGKHFVLASADGAIGVCLRPGILLRIALPLLKWSGKLEADDGVYRMGDVVLAWRDGFLIASSSPRYVRAATAQTAEVLKLSSEPHAIVLERRVDPTCRLTLRAADSLSLEGWVGVEITERQLPLTLAATWPEDPILEIAGSSAREVIAVVGSLVPDFPGLELVKQAFEELEDELPRGWARGQDEFSLAIVSVDTDEFLAVPEIVLAIRSEEDLPPMRTPREAIRYEWAGLSGWMRPWLGEKMSVCAVTTQSFRLFTSQERTMARFLGHLEEGPPLEADVAATLDLAHTAAIAGVLARRAAEHELLAHQNAADVDALLLPLLDAVGALGTLRLEGKSEDGRLVIHAVLDGAESRGTGP